MRIKQLGVVGLLFAFICAGVMLPQGAPLGPPVAVAQESESEPKATASKEVNSDLLSAEASPQTTSASGDSSDETSVAAAVKPSPSESTVLTQKARASLEKFGNIEYNEVPFKDVKTDLEEKLGFNIVLDQSAMDDALTEEELVNVGIRNVRYSDGLRLMLYDFNATYTIQNGILRIISIDNLNDPENHSRVMLDVQPTLDLIKKFDGRVNSPQYKKFDKSVIPVMALSETIMSVVQDDAWRDTGQGDAALQITGGILIIRGPENLLSEVKDFVQDLHAQLEAKTH